MSKQVVFCGFFCGSREIESRNPFDRDGLVLFNVKKDGIKMDLKKRNVNVCFDFHIFLKLLF